MKTILLPLIGLWLLGVHNPLWSQKADDIILEVGPQDVTVSEFRYIYEKNNRDKATYSEESILEYLDLYTNFKLKVLQAKSQGLDEDLSYKAELDNYRNQLASSYLIDREVIGAIAEDIHNRQKWDIELQHILISLRPKASEAKTKEAYQRAEDILAKIKNGTSFEEAAKTYSQDKNTAAQGGNIGFITAALPDGFVALENAAYTHQTGEIVGPIRTNLGVHLIKIGQRRPARGKLEIAQILIKKKKNGQEVTDAAAQAKEAHAIVLAQPEKFDSLAAVLSDDKKTADKGGYLGFFGIGEYQKEFEDAVFQLKQDEQISAPIETSIGYHIVKRISKKQPDNLEQLRAKVKTQMSRGDRFDIKKKSFVESIKTKIGYQETPEALQVFADSLDKSFFTHTWQVPAYSSIPMMKLGNRTFHLNQLGRYAADQNMLRHNNSSRSYKAATREIFDAFVQEKALEIMQEKLEETYPEFDNLMREYREGILLFEITKQEVWDRATKDTTGLRNYFNANRNKYLWEPRAVISKYTVRSNDPVFLEELREEVKTKSAEEILQIYNRDNRPLITHEPMTVERSNDIMRGVPFEEGAVSRAEINKGLKVGHFIQVHERLPASQKTLNEARGYVISDYQDELEKQWIASLRDKYKININKRVVKKLAHNQ